MLTILVIPSNAEENTPEINLDNGTMIVFHKIFNTSDTISNIGVKTLSIKLAKGTNTFFHRFFAVLITVGNIVFPKYDSAGFIMSSQTLVNAVFKNEVSGFIKSVKFFQPLFKSGIISSVRKDRAGSKLSTIASVASKNPSLTSSLLAKTAANPPTKAANPATRRAAGPLTPAIAVASPEKFIPLTTPLITERAFEIGSRSFTIVATAPTPSIAANILLFSPLFEAEVKALNNPFFISVAISPHSILDIALLNISRIPATNFPIAVPISSKLMDSKAPLILSAIASPNSSQPFNPVTRLTTDILFTNPMNVSHEIMK